MAERVRLVERARMSESSVLCNFPSPLSSAIVVMIFGGNIDLMLEQLQERSHQKIPLSSENTGQKKQRLWRTKNEWENSRRNSEKLSEENTKVKEESTREGRIGARRAWTLFGLYVLNVNHFFASTTQAYTNLICNLKEEVRSWILRICYLEETIHKEFFFFGTNPFLLFTKNTF